MASSRGKRKAKQIADEGPADEDNEDYKEGLRRKAGRDRGSGSASTSAGQAGTSLLPPEDEGDGRGDNVSSACEGGGDDGGDDGGGEYSGGGADLGGGGEDAGGGGDGGGGSGRGRRQRKTREVSYAEPSEDDIYRRPRGASRAEPSDDGKRASREHGSRSEPQQPSSCGYCGDPFPQVRGLG